MTLRPTFPASWRRQWLHQPIQSMNQPSRFDPPARVLHQPPMTERLLPEDFTREVRRRVDIMCPPVEPDPQPEPTATPLEGSREEFISEVRRRLDRVDRILLIVLRIKQLEQRTVIDERLLRTLAESQINSMRIAHGIYQRLPEHQVDRAEDSDEFPYDT